MSEGRESEETYPGYEPGDALRTPSIVTNGEGDFSDHGNRFEKLSEEDTEDDQCRPFIRLGE